MIYEDSVEKYHGGEEYLQVITDAAHTIDACGNDIQKVAENIISSYDILNTKEASHKSVHYTKADDLKKLTILQSSAREAIDECCKKVGRWLLSG